MVQLLLFESEEEGDGPRAQRSGSFIDNMQLPVHRWFRYSAGFSADWAGQTIREVSAGRAIRIFDPFVGSGTVILEAERAGVEGAGLEAHPFIARVAKAKLHWRLDPKALCRMGAEITKAAKTGGGSADGYGGLISKCYPVETLAKLDALKNAWRKNDDGSPVSQLCWLALVSILRAASPVGTAQWQYILPKKTKAKYVEPLRAFEERVALFASDMAVWRAKPAGPGGRIFCEDARECAGIPDGWADLVVTSPPYANNYDYADATRFEMTFFGEVNGWRDLQAVVRSHLVRSCTQHVAPYASRMSAVLKDPLLAPIADELAATCARLEVEKASHGGKKQYDAMIAHYFLDLARVWKALRRVIRPGGPGLLRCRRLRAVRHPRPGRSLARRARAGRRL